MRASISLVLDPVTALLCGLAAGLVAFTIASAPITYFGAGTTVTSINNPQVLEPLRVPPVDYALFTEWFEGIFARISPLSAILAFYILALDREYGYSLLTIVFGEGVLRYYTARILVSLIMYDLLILVGASIGLALNDVMFLIHEPYTALTIILVILYIATIQTLISFTIVILVRRAILALITSITVLYTLAVTRLWVEVLPSRPETALIMFTLVIIATVLLTLLASRNLQLRA